MAEKAQKTLDKTKKSKTRKAPPKGSSDAKDKKPKGMPPIFVQPPNLAKGCILKDYQLEGVRWTASLFENGVSGILADGKFVGWFSITTFATRTLCF